MAKHLEMKRRVEFAHRSLVTSDDQLQPSFGSVTTAQYLSGQEGRGDCLCVPFVTLSEDPPQSVKGVFPRNV